MSPERALLLARRAYTAALALAPGEPERRLIWRRLTELDERGRAAVPNRGRAGRRVGGGRRGIPGNDGSRGKERR